MALICYSNRFGRLPFLTWRPRFIFGLLVFILIIGFFYYVDFVVYTPTTLLTVVHYGSVAYDVIVCWLEESGLYMGDYSLSRDRDKGFLQLADTLRSNNIRIMRLNARYESYLLQELLGRSCVYLETYILPGYRSDEDLHIKLAPLFDSLNGCKHCRAHVFHLENLIILADTLNFWLIHFNIAERATFRLPHLFIGSISILIFSLILIIYFLIRLAICFLCVLLDVLKYMWCKRKWLK